MKKQIVSRMVILLSSALFFVQPVISLGAQVSQNDVIEEIAEIDEPSEIEEMESYFEAKDIRLWDLNLTQLEDEVLDRYLADSTDEQIAAWISGLSLKERQELLKRDTMLTKTLEFYGEGCEECGFTWGSHFETAMEYYERLGACDKCRSDYTFAATSGYIEIAFAVPGKETQVSQIKVSGIDTSKRTSLRQYDLSCSVSNARYGLALQIPEDKKWHTWSASSNKTSVESDLSRCEEKGPEAINYYDFVPEVYFKKPAGYKLSNPVYSNYDTTLHTFYETCTKKSYTYNGTTYNGIALLENAVQGVDNYESEKEIRFRASANLGRHYGVGVKNKGIVSTPAGNHERATFTLTPANYTMQFDGNGSTGSDSSQIVTYAEMFTYPAGPTPAEYTITYHGNGGSVNVTSEKIPRSFLGWNTDAKANTGATGSYLADKTKNGAVITNYAIWGGASKSAVLPDAAKSYTVTYDANGGSLNQTSAIAEATFLGWSKSMGGAVDAGKAGAAYMPVGNETLYARFENGTVLIPDAIRTGYQLAGWYSAPASGSLITRPLETYQPASNTTLYAQWMPNAYQIQLDADGGVLEAQPVLHAFYDQSILLPVPKRTGYIFKGWHSDTATYRAEYVLNLSSVDGDVVCLQAQWEPEEVAYLIRCFFRDNTDTVYHLDDTKTVTCVALADSMITVPAPDMTGYDTPSAKLVTIAADGSTCVDFYYDIKQTAAPQTNPGASQQVMEDILKRLKEIESVSKLTKEEWNQIYAWMASSVGISKDTASQLAELIRSSSLLTEKEKKEILEAYANGYISEALQEKQIQVIQNAALPVEKKSELIRAINQLSNLTLEQQQKIKELLEIGSSVSYKINGVTFEIKKNADGTLAILLKGLNGQKEVVIPDSVTVAGKTYAITEIAKDAFQGNEMLESVVIGNNVAKIGESAFESCKALKNVIIGPNVKEIGDKAFKNCVKIKEIKIPGSVLTIGASAFEGCSILQKVTFGEGLIQIGRKAFYNCKALTKIKLPKSLIKIKGYAFSKCTKLKTVTFATGSLLVTMNEGVFCQCSSLTKIKIPSRVNSLAKKIFYKDGKLASVTGMKKVTRIGASAFEDCKKLKSIVLGTKLQTIEKRAFYRCSNLNKVTLKSKAITSVGSRAFQKCGSGLKFSVPVEKQAAYVALFKGKY